MMVICGQEIARHVGLEKQALLKLSKVLTDGKMLETKERLLNCYLISNLPYGSVCWTIPSCFSESKQSNNRWENVVRKKEKTAELLYDL